MKTILFFLITLYSLSCSALEATEARHLLSRTTYGYTQSDINDLLPLDYSAAVDWLLTHTHTEAKTPPPALIHSTWYAGKPQTDKQRRQRVTAIGQHKRQLKQWWWHEILTTPSPLTELMTLFWHDHFATELKTVGSPLMMYRQNVLLRRHALGHFDELLHAIATDPAMMVYLDLQKNQKGKPNENFAREIMELFTLGEGHYSERDIQEAARAFTGYSVDRFTGQVFFRPARFDEGEKNVLGQSGHWNNHDVVEVILQNPRTAVYITEKLWRFFISTPPDVELIEQIADRFRANQYDIRGLVHDLLISKPFRALENRQTLIKSPVELIAGTVRQLQVSVENVGLLDNRAAQMGMSLFDPPDVSGWKHGDAWINSDTLLKRHAFLQYVLKRFHHQHQLEVGNIYAYMPHWQHRMGISPQQIVDELLLARPESNCTGKTGLRRSVRCILFSPAFQYK